MRIAVITLTRDRIAYTAQCFAALALNAGCEYEHYVLDQGSADGTQDWLTAQVSTRPGLHVVEQPRNIGISRGLNHLLDTLGPAAFDCIVKFDNDCLITQPNTLRDVCDLAVTGGALLSPRILGLKQPPQPARTLRIGDEPILDIPQIGGIFLAAPAWVYDEFRYSESNPPWGLDDVEICAWFRAQGGTCGYVERLEAWHYLGTDKQRIDDAEYFARKDAEYAA